MTINKIKKKILVIFTSIVTLILTSLFFYTIDSYQVEHNQKPIFIFNKHYFDDGGTIVYYGLGYQIINWKMLTDKDNTFLVGTEKHYLIGINFEYIPHIELTEKYV